MKRFLAQCAVLLFLGYGIYAQHYHTANITFTNSKITCVYDKTEDFIKMRLHRNSYKDDYVIKSKYDEELVANIKNLSVYSEGNGLYSAFVNLCEPEMIKMYLDNEDKFTWSEKENAWYYENADAEEIDGYINNNENAESDIPVSDEYDDHEEGLDWYTDLGVMRIMTSDEIPANVSVEVVLGYEQNDEAAKQEIMQKTVEIKDYLRKYFSLKTAEELKPQNEENLKIEIRDEMNDSIFSLSKIKDVKFLSLTVIEP